MVPENDKMSYRMGVYANATEEAVKEISRTFDAVFTEPNEDYVRNAHEAGLKVYACIWTFRAPQDPELGVESITGRRMLWAGAGCPNNPKVQENSRKLVEKAASLGVDGIVLDAARFPSMGSGFEAFLSCFCPSCRKKAEELGYNMESMRACLKDFLINFEKMLCRGEFTGLSQVISPELLQWLEFRAKSISKVVRDLKEHAKSIDPSLEFGAALFSPDLAFLVGQDYGMLSQIYDFIQPMLYHRGEGIACINYELASLARIWPQERQQQILACVYRSLGYEKFKPPLSPDELEKNGLPEDVISVEAERARQLAKGSAITPVLWTVNLSVEEVKKLVDIAMASKPDGLVFFNYQESPSLPLLWQK
jgi:hypothetical protein